MQSTMRMNGPDTEERGLIAHEHERLERFLHDLRDTCSEFANLRDCSGCDRGTRACCQGRISSFFYDFIDLVSQHIENEETIISHYLINPTDSEYFRQHQMAHTALMRELRSLMQDSIAISRQGDTSEAIRRLYKRITAMFGDHARHYDDHFLHAA